MERIAAFIGVDANDALIDLATHHSSFEFMSANKSPFSKPWLRARAEVVVGIPADGDSVMVRTGRAGDHCHEFPARTLNRFDEIWTETIGTEFGYTTYDDLVTDLSGTTQRS